MFIMPHTPITPQTPNSVTITEDSTTSRSSVRLSARKHLEQALSNALAAAEPVANQNACDLDQLHRYQQQLLEQLASGRRTLTASAAAEKACRRLGFEATERVVKAFVLIRDEWTEPHEPLADRDHHAAPDGSRCLNRAEGDADSSSDDDCNDDAQRRFALQLRRGLWSESDAAAPAASSRLVSSSADDLAVVARDGTTFEAPTDRSGDRELGDGTSEAPPSGAAL